MESPPPADGWTLREIIQSVTGGIGALWAAVQIYRAGSRPMVRSIWPIGFPEIGIAELSSTSVRLPVRYIKRRPGDLAFVYLKVLDGLEKGKILNPVNRPYGEDVNAPLTDLIGAQPRGFPLRDGERAYRFEFARPQFLYEGDKVQLVVAAGLRTGLSGLRLPTIRKTMTARGNVNV